MYIHPQVSISSYLGWIPGIGDKAGAADAVHRTEFVVFRSVPTDPDGAEDVARPVANQHTTRNRDDAATGGGASA
jgi:hypothetical protein